MSSNVARIRSFGLALTLVCAGALTGCASEDPAPPGVDPSVQEASDLLVIIPRTRVVS